MKTNALLILFSLILFVAQSQSFVGFNKLKNMTDSAYRIKNYTLLTRYYEELLGLPENQKPEISASLYYDIACGYSLNHEKAKALFYFEKSFKTSNIKQKRNPVTASHLMQDTDLDNIRDTETFSQFINKYYPTSVAEFILSKEVSYNSLLDFVKYSNQTDLDVFRAINIQGKTIYWQRDVYGKYIFNTKRLGIPTYQGIERITFKNCDFQLNLIWEGAEFLEFKTHIKEDFYFENCKFNGRLLIVFITLNDVPTFHKCEFRKDVKLEFNVSPRNNYQGIRFDSCSFSFTNIFINSEKPLEFFMRGNKSSDSLDITIYGNNISKAEFSGNSFKTKNLKLNFGEVRKLNFRDNTINNLTLSKTNIQSEFDLQSSIIQGKFLLFETYFSDGTSHNIDWTIIDSLKLGTPIPYRGVYSESEVLKYTYYADLSSMTTEIPKREKIQYLTGGQSDAVSNKNNFQELLGLYSMFLNLYKAKNDIESYNNCFIEVKELQSNRLKHLYNSNKTFESYFRWKLSQLLKYYVRYGTDPARAIVISVYIIITFGIFFFFFPSDWDITSKTRLIANYKDFIQKNEKGYIKPFFILLGGFCLSLINALTLSLNAFITLGFGNIPTHGVARYFCIIEGFVGWFLLSIFTVAMINQVI